MPHALLIVDDDPDVLKAAAVTLAPAWPTIETARNTEGLAARAAEFDAVLLDMNFTAAERNGDVGLDTLARFQAADPALSIVLMTAFGGVGLAVRALKRGAVDFVLKPWRNELLAETLRTARALTLERRRFGSGLNLDELERRAIMRALVVYDGNISHAASALGLTRPALYRRMERHGLQTH